jgi:16S rRNA C967 or C1407 C5-methylase (RsmB/RsmF family)
MMQLSSKNHKLNMRIEKIKARINKLQELNAPQVLIDKEKDWLDYNIKLLEESGK